MSLRLTSFSTEAEKFSEDLSADVLLPRSKLYIRRNMGNRQLDHGSVQNRQLRAENAGGL